MQPKGWAAVKIGKNQYKGKLVDGKVAIKLPKFKTTARSELKVKYLGQRRLQARLQVHQPVGGAGLTSIGGRAVRPATAERVETP